jgi:hypothetical protein
MKFDKRIKMAEKYKFPEELRLITDEPLEDDGWGEFSLDSDERKADLVIRYLVQFMTDYHCLISPAFDLEKHISTLIKNHACPLDSKRGLCPHCKEAPIELHRNGLSSCGLFVTTKYLNQNQPADLSRSQKKTKALLNIYQEIDSGVPANLAYHGYQKKHLDILNLRARTSSYWAKVSKFLLQEIASRWELNTEEIDRLGKIRISLEKEESATTQIQED